MEEPLEPSGAPRSVRRVPALVAALLLALSACGDGGGRLGSHGLLVWTAPATRDVERPRTLRRWDLTEVRALEGAVADGGPVRWDLGDGTAEVRAPESALRDDGLWLSGGEQNQPLSLVLTGPLELAGADRLEVRGHGNTHTRLTVELHRGGALLGRLGPVPLAHDAADPLTRLDLAWSLADRGPADRLTLHLDGRPRSLTLTSVALLDRPDARLVPPPAGAPVLVELAGEARACVGLAPGEALVAAGPGVPPAGTLRLALGRPAASRPAGELVVRAGAEELGRFRVGPTPGWRELSLPWPGGVHPPALVLEAPEGTAVLVAEARVEPPTPPTPRRVLLITSDTHRGDHLGSAPGGVDLSTPVLDRLAARGLRFDDCFVSTNFTNPSHAALLTGVSPRDTGLLDNSHALGEAAPTLAEAFAAAGYRTWAAVSAGHLRPEVSGLGQGFQRVAWPGRAEQPVTATLERVLGWLEREAPARLFLWVHLFDAHMPYEAPVPFDRMYYDGPADPFDPALPDPGWSQPPPGNLAGLRVPAFGTAQYAAQVSWLDHELARLLEHPALVDGVQAFVGDHGESLGAHGIWFLHDGLYPDTLHVPLLLSWPGAPTGAVRDDPVSHLDLGRTLLDLSGLGDAPFPGRPLTSPAPAPRFALAAHGSEASLTVGDEHLVLRLVGRGEGRPAHGVELYDLAADPRCERDLVDERPQRARDLRARLVSWLQAAEPRGWVGAASDDATTREQLRQLGYVDGGRSGPLFTPDDCAWCRRLAPP